MINRIVYDAFVSGGKTAVKVTAAGGAGLLLYTLATNEKVIYLPGALACIAVISVFMGGISGGMSAGAQGWLHGLVVAFMYTVISTIIRFCLFPESGVDQAMVIQTGSVLAAGSIGGVAGINARFLRKRRRFIGSN